MTSAVLMIAMNATAINAQEFTRGAGVYSGEPREYTGHSPRVDSDTYRDLALRREAALTQPLDFR